MDIFRVLYFPSSDCSPLTLAKAILIFDEINFFDHPSIAFRNVGTIGHDSRIRKILPELKNEGYSINVIKPGSGPIEGEIEKIIDSDLSNEEFRKIFYRLMHNDPSFILRKVPNGNYGKLGSAEELRKKILSLQDRDIPRSVEEIKRFKPDEYGISPSIHVAISMASDSYQLNFASYIAVDKDLNLFGDSRGMNLLLNSKFNGIQPGSAKKSLTHQVTFTLMERLISDKAFVGKSIIT
jgi:hypothetical protein